MPIENNPHLVNTSFLHFVAKDVLKKHGQDLDKIAIVFPNKRASIFFNRELYREAGHALWSPKYITISELFREHSTLQVPDPITLVFQVYNVFCDITGSDETLDHFFSWGQLMLADFDDIDKNEVDPDKLFIDLQAWEEMNDFSFLTEAQRQSLEEFFHTMMQDSLLQRRFKNIWEHLGSIYHELHQRLEKQGLAYEGMLYREVIKQENIDFQYETYIFVGFNLLQKVEQDLFRRLKMEGKAEFYWDYDVNYINADAGKYIKQYLDMFPNQLNKDLVCDDIDSREIFDNMRSPKDICMISAPTEEIQARYVGQWLSERDRIKDGNRTAVVMADENLLPSVIHSLPGDIQNVNVTTGFPLNASEVSVLVDALIALQLKGLTNDHRHFQLQYINRVLLHPYAQYLSDDCKTLASQLNSNHRYYPSIKEMTDGFDETLSLLFQPLEEKDGTLPLLSWMTDLLKIIGQNTRSISNDLLHQSIFSMYTLLNRLDDIMSVNIQKNGSQDGRRIDEKSGKQLVSVYIVQRLIQQVIQSTAIPFHGEPAIGTQIMGVLETRNLDFEHVILLSCNEGKLPKNINDASFIPHSIRVGYGLTTVENKVAIFAYYFQSLIQRAHDITLLYNNATDDGQKGEMSRFMLLLMINSYGKQHIKRYTLTAGQNQSSRLCQAKSKTAEVMRVLRDMKSISPSALGQYMRCPLQFYYNTICQLHQQDEDNIDEIDNTMFGDLFHHSAELIYKQLSQQQTTITKDMILSVLKDPSFLDRIIDQAFREKLFQADEHQFVPQYNGLQMLNKNVIRLYLQRLLRLDAAWAPFDILALEESFYDKVSFPVNDQQHSLSIGGKVDRIDKVNQNGKSVVRIVDYKTGRPLTSLPTDVKDIFNVDNIDTKHTNYYLQTMLYAGVVKYGANSYKKVGQMLQQAVAPALLFIRQASDETYNPILSFAVGRGARETLDDISALWPEFLDQIKQLLAEIFNPEIDFTPTTHTERCENCPYRDICHE
jgi:hypothetical protein